MLPETVVFFGDWHGNWKYALKALRALHEDGSSFTHYVHLGDFGLEDNSDHCFRVNQFMENLGKEMWIVPGNHENYGWLEAQPLDSRGLIVIANNLYAIPRGYRWEWAGVTFAGLGGAYSIDRRWRVKNKGWWPQEVITEEDFNRVVNGGQVDVLVTHDGPWLPPFSRNRFHWLTRYDKRASKRNRDYIIKTILAINPKLTLHGHHHYAYIRKWGDHQIVGLGSDGFDYSLNRFVLDLSTFSKEGTILVID